MSNISENPALPEKGLVIGVSWAQRIVSGEKTWELRKRATSIRGPIGIIAKGTGTVMGAADVVDCIGPLSLEQLMENRALACETEEEILQDVKDGYVYAWVLDNAVEFETPVPYRHPSGAVTWVNLAPSPEKTLKSASKAAIFNGPAVGDDFDRIGNKLSEQTLSQGAPAYNPLSMRFRAVAGGKVVGEAVATANWGKLEVDLMYVEPEHRGQGIGKQLMGAVEDFARASNLKAIRLNTPTWQGAGFYETCGYTEMGRIPLDNDAAGTPHFEVTYMKILE